MAAYISTVTSKGQMTLPVEVRRQWNINPGDEIEIYTDHRGELCLRPLNAGPLDFLKGVSIKPALVGIATDEDAIAIAVAHRNAWSGGRQANE